MRGMSQVKSNLNKMPDRILKAGKEGLREVADTIYNDSRVNYVPIDTGELQNSARLDEMFRPKGLTIVISYNTDYAIYVHEIPYRHVHGSWKYLENPFNKHVREIRPAIQSRLGGAL